MKVIIELNENITLENVDDDIESIWIHSHDKDHKNNQIWTVKIDDIKLALRKMIAK